MPNPLAISLPFPAASGRAGRILALLAAVLTLGLVHAGAARASGLGYVPADDGAYITAVTQIDPQMYDISVSSPALQTVGLVRIILPHDWSAQPTATWPALYMINGSGDPMTYKSWTAYTNIESFMSPRDVLTVMPTDGAAGYGSTEVNGGPNYDAWEATEVPQLMQRNFRSSGRNAIGGLSSGGFAAFQLAELHPNEFRAAAAYSGLLDTQALGLPLVIEADLARSGQNPDALWGSPFFNSSTWTAHNPRAQVSKFLGTGISLFVSCGNGQPGPFDDATNLVDDVTGEFYEGTALRTNQSFLAAAANAGVKVTTDLYGPGSHTWPYWQREFQRSWPVLAGGLGVPAT